MSNEEDAAIGEAAPETPTQADPGTADATVAEPPAPEDAESSAEGEDGKSGQVITGVLRPITMVPGQGAALSREGLSWFVKQLVFSDGEIRTHADLVTALTKEVEQAKAIAESFEGFAEFEADPEGTFEQLLRRVTEGPDSSAAKWATSLYVFGSGLLGEDDEFDDKLRQVLLWQLSKFRTMLLFTRHIQDLAWRGYRNYGVDVLVEALTAWEASDKTESEDHWQEFLQDQPYLINLIFQGPVVVHMGKAYLGGKKVDNTGGQIVDFLLENSIGGNAALLEIKRPGTTLLTRTAYRGNEIYAPSNELAGSVSQILNYRDTIMTGNISPLDVFMPSCVVLVGNYAKELDSPGKRRSFELYRSSLNGVSIVTYDELFDRLKKILDVLRGEG